MLDMYVSNVLSLKRFHGAETGNTHECLLTLSIGRVRILKYGHRAVAFLDRFAHKDDAFALVRVEIAPKIIGVQKEEDAATCLIAYA